MHDAADGRQPAWDGICHYSAGISATRDVAHGEPQTALQSIILLCSASKWQCTMQRLGLVMRRKQIVLAMAE